MEKTIIALLGLPGSGKSEIIDYLIKKYHWPKVYFGDVTFDELKRRGLEINEQNERSVREGLRQEFGNLHYAKTVISKIEKLKDDKIILVESLYDWVEYLLFKEKFGDNFFPIAVYASPATRYKRLSARIIRPLTPETAQSRDYAQIENIRQAGPIAMAAYTVDNEKEGLDNLRNTIDKIINKII
jgi:dephospho-CoA kinase